MLWLFFLLIHSIVVSVDAQTTFASCTYPNLTSLTNSVAANTLALNLGYTVPIPLSSNLEFYGDSIAWGKDAASNQEGCLEAIVGSPFTTRRWSYLLSTALGKIENNFAVNCAAWADAGAQVYNNHVPGRSVFFGFGINDITLSPFFSDELLESAQNFLVFASLPASSIVNARAGSPTAVTSGNGWSPTQNYASYGIGSTTTGDTITVNVTGRFVVVSTSLVALSTTNYASITISIDGITIVINQPQLRGTGNSYLNHDDGNGLFVYDTNSSSTTKHLVVATVGHQFGNFNANTYFDWFAGFSPNQVGASAVFLTAIQSIHSYNHGGGDFETIRQAVNIGYKRLATKLRVTYGLPVYFVEESGSYSIAQLQNDLLHPNPNGHQYIYQKVLGVIQNGEYKY